MPNLVKIGSELVPKMSENQVWRRTPEKAKIIYPPPVGGHNKQLYDSCTYRIYPYKRPGGDAFFKGGEGYN